MAQEPKEDFSRLRCAWDGEPSTWMDFARRVRLAFERTARRKRHLLGPEVVSQLSGRAWTITQDIEHARPREAGRGHLSADLSSRTSWSIAHPRHRVETRSSPTTNEETTRPVHGHLVVKLEATIPPVADCVGESTRIREPPLQGR